MTRDDIIRMAREANLWITSDERREAVVRFAALVATAEREACAKECEDEIRRVKPIYSVVAENILKAIRARGEK
jgi:hypothetical protein